MFGGCEKPIVLINGAVSADGKLALENRSVIQFSSKRDQHFVFQLRARVDAVLCGAETIESFSIDLAGGPAECRQKRKQRRLRPEPIRVVVSSDGKVDPGAPVFRHTESPVVVLTTHNGIKRCSARLKRNFEVKAFGNRTVDFISAFRWLRDKRGVNKIVCEGGGETNATLIQAGVVDQIHLTVCPLVLCGAKAPTICDGSGFASVEHATRLKLKSVKVLNGEIFLVYRVLAKTADRC